MLRPEEPPPPVESCVICAKEALAVVWGHPLCAECVASWEDAAAVQRLEAVHNPPPASFGSRDFEAGLKASNDAWRAFARLWAQDRKARAA